VPVPSRNVLAIGAVAVVGLVLVVGVARIAGRSPAPAPLRIAQAAPSGAGAPGTPPPDLATPLAAAPTSTPTATPSPTPTPRTTPSPTPSTTQVTIPDRQIQAHRGRSATLLAVTAPRTSCTIAVGYAPPPQVGPATSNDAGTVTWKWTVSILVRPGTYQILVTCGTGSAGATITVS
jgi:hypothetical protein